jgi:hypothetical protein
MIVPYDDEDRIPTPQAARVRGVSISKMCKDRVYGSGPPYELDGRKVKYRMVTTNRRRVLIEP